MLMVDALLVYDEGVLKWVGASVSSPSIERKHHGCGTAGRCRGQAQPPWPASHSQSELQKCDERGVCDVCGRCDDSAMQLLNN